MKRRVVSLTGLAVLVTGSVALTGCDYWPPALESRIETLRSQLNDALDDRARLEQELSEVQSARTALQQQVEQISRTNQELRRRLSTIAVTSDQAPSSLEHAGYAITSSSLKRGSYTPLQAEFPPTKRPRVVQLQRLLAQHGIPIRIDGLYGPTTASAVRGFQRIHGLRADGVVGPLTYAALRRTDRTARLVRHLHLQRPPQTGQDVRRIQRALLRAGHRVKIDGHYGPETTTAVTRFQRRHGLDPDGIVGQRTWTALIRSH